MIALPTVIMAFMYGQSRIFFVMARDGLLPQRLSAVHPRFGTPVLMTFITSVIVALIAAFVPLQNIAAVANAGTLIAFIAVAVCMIVTRRLIPQHPRMFGPAATWIIGIGGDRRLHLPVLQPADAGRCISVLIWNVVGLAIYLLWARRRSLLEPRRPTEVQSLDEHGLCAQAPTNSGATTVASAVCTARCKRSASVSTSTSAAVAMPFFSITGNSVRVIPAS